jgi:hypothetical protein
MGDFGRPAIIAAAEQGSRGPGIKLHPLHLGGFSHRFVNFRKGRA